MVVKTAVVKGQVGNTKLYGTPIPGKIMLRETPTDIQVFVHPGSIKHERPPLRDTGEELCKCLGIGDEKMKRLTMEVLLEDDHRDIEDMLSKQRVGGHHVDDLEAISIKATAENQPPSASHLRKPPANVEACPEAPTNATLPPRQTSSAEISTAEPAVLTEIVNQSRPPKIPHQGYASTAPVPEMKPRELKQAARHIEVGESIRVGGRENISPQTYPSIDRGYNKKKLQPNKLVGPTIRPAQISSPNKTPYERPLVMTSGRDQSREEKVGIWGEAAVFNILQDVLGSVIDESAWTSELRHQVQGHTVWTPEDPDTLYSDFTVHDSTGKLLNWMVTNNIQIPSNWRSHGDDDDDVLYHIEVKSTVAESAKDPFFMSHLQMDKAKEVSESSQSPREVYVIFRVYDVENELPGLEVYCDPWGMMRRGKLKCATQEWRVMAA
jgi:Domain of unknown function (DUF3883)